MCQDIVYFFVKNEDHDKIGWELNEFSGGESGAPNNTSPQVPLDLQLVDRERKLLGGVKITSPSDWLLAMLFVDSKNNYKTDENIPENSILNYGNRMIDLESHVEINPLPFQTFKWYSVNPKF